MPETAFERRIVSDRRYAAVHDQDGTLLGYYRSSGGYEEIVDRDGHIVWSDEVGLEQPLFSPVDLIGPGVVTAGGRAAIRLTGRLISRFAARTAGRLAARGASTAVSRSSPQLLTHLREAARRVAARLGLQSGLARQAQEMASRLGRQVTLNLGGTGEIPGAVININPCRGYHDVSHIPNLIRTGAERIGSLFRPGTIHRIVSNNVEHGHIDWVQVARGARTVLRPRGEVSISPFHAGAVREHVREIARAFTDAGFEVEVVETFGAMIVRAVKP